MLEAAIALLLVIGEITEAAPSALMLDSAKLGTVPYSAHLLAVKRGAKACGAHAMR
jgi:hypothetical protein